MDGYFHVSGIPDRSKLDILERLEEDFDDYDDDIQFKLKVSLCHLPAAADCTVVSPKSLLILKSDRMVYGSCQCGVGGRCDPIKIPPEMRQWWEQGTTGFIYSKLSLQVTLGTNTVNRVYGYVDKNSGMLRDICSADVEIECRCGEIVKCHRAVLASNCGVLEVKFQEILEKGEGGGGGGGAPWKLKMEMSKECVHGLMVFLYCGEVGRGTWSCDLALELLKGAREYKLLELQVALEEIVVSKGDSDFKYFSVEGSLELFLYARNEETLKHLRDKAVRVLRT